jgi:hypothetical protein
MDSISPAAARTAGNQRGLSGVLTFFGKLMDTDWLGFPPFASRDSTTHARSHHGTSHTPPSLAR